MAKTLPDASGETNDSHEVLVESAYCDVRTGALYIHEDLKKVKGDWEDEAHIPPAKATERFGDVESFAKYVTTFHTLASTPFITWNASGLRAELDYHSVVDGDVVPGRRQWIATHPFVSSPEWDAWTGIAKGHAIQQAKAVEFLEDHAADIKDPPAVDLLNLLRKMRTTVNKTAEAHVREDGTTAVTWSGDNGVAARGGTADLPSEFTIGIPVLKGHLNAEGKAVLYQLVVRVRASVDDKAQLALRFSIPLAERTLETVLAERVAQATTLLGDIDVLRAAD
jgi:hypothetical protein